MKLTTTACGLLCAAIIVMSCNNNKIESPDIQLSELKQQPANYKTGQEPPVIAAGVSRTAATDSAEKQAPAPVQENIDWDKKIVKTANVKYEVKNFNQFNKDVREKVKRSGGYVAQEDNHQYEDRKEISLIIKVPVAQFETMMNDIQGKDIKQVGRSIKTEDVTGEVVDIKSRLEAKKQMRLKYLEFLKQSKNMGEVLEVQQEINNIQEDIESAEGRVQYLSVQAAYSTINMNFYQPLEGFKGPADDNSFWNKTGQAFSNGGEMIQGLLLALLSIWPLIAAALAGWFIWKKRKHTPVVAGK